MKSQNSIMSKVVLVAAFLLATLSGTQALQAASTTIEQPLASVRYMGKEGDLLIFDVHFRYGTQGRFRILDENHNVLFEDKVQPGGSAKRFKIIAQVAEKIHFESTTKEQSQRNTFAVAYQVEEKIKVSEVK